MLNAVPGPVMRRLEVRLHCKADAKQRRIEGYASTFNDVDLGGDVVLPGAFAETIARHADGETMPKLLWAHDRADPIGVLTEWHEDEKGLWIAARISEIPEGDRALVQAADGVVDGMSIGYIPLAQRKSKTFKMADGRPANELVRLHVIEVSLVPFPMNMQATVTAVKAVEETANQIRIRQRDPVEFEPDSFRTVAVPGVEGVSMIVGRLLPGNVPEGHDPEAMVVQAYRFDRERWTMDEATRWVDEHEMSGAGTKATWDTAYVNNLPDAAFALILPGGEKDKDGKTVPRTLRVLPHHTAAVTDPADDDTVDVPHLRNGLARVGQTSMSRDNQDKARSHLLRHAEALGVGEATQQTEGKSMEKSTSETLVASEKQALDRQDIAELHYRPARACRNCAYKGPWCAATGENTEENWVCDAFVRMDPAKPLVSLQAAVVAESPETAAPESPVGEMAAPIPEGEKAADHATPVTGAAVRALRRKNMGKIKQARDLLAEVVNDEPETAGEEKTASEPEATKTTNQPRDPIAEARLAALRALNARLGAPSLS